MIKKNRGNLLEQHAEKIVLAVVGIISVVLLWMFVLTSPNAVKISTVKLGPGEIDRYIKTRADQLDAALKADPVPREYVPRAVNNYVAMLDNTLERIPDFHIPGVAANPQAVEEERRYAMPLVASKNGGEPVIGSLDEVVAEAIRGVAHVPLEEIGPENPYDRAMTRLEDIDLVTVQASFDIAAVHRNFIQSFIMGRGVKNEWKDEELARPVFAAVQLQRRRLLEGGRWSDWEVVERPKIDPYRAKLNVPEKVSDLAYDISVQKTQFKAFEFQRNLLQPRPYRFASSNALWLTPSFHKEYVRIEERDRKEQLRQERDRMRNERARERGIPAGYDRTRGRGRTAATDTYPDYGEGAYGGRTGRQPLRGRRTVDPRRRRDMTGTGDFYDERGEFGYDPRYMPRGRQERTVEDVIADNMKIIIRPGTRLEEMREPLVFWAHDDTVEPGNTYQYRVRLGVFNPIAGKNWFYQQEQQYKDRVILWSDFSEVSEEIAIAPRVYFFPTDITGDGGKAVTIDVFKYHMGNWRSETFDVYPGEMIGKTVDFKPQLPVDDMGMRGAYDEFDYGMGMTPGAMPEKVDFSTGAMLVDVVKTDAWVGLRSLVRTKLADMLYTRDGVTMLHLPVKRNNWTSTMKVQYAKVEEASRENVLLNQTKRTIDLFQQGPGMYSPGGLRDRMIEGRQYDFAGEEEYIDSRMGRYPPGGRDF